ncbi:MAG TPA: heterodisulfide reductase-related iron-sulfur binding cluster [Nitrospira sp.]|nr:heterodisulfide reductase-related iron-sulfur binding cluster [Nitrospira sp.]
MPLHMAPHYRKWDIARSALKAIPGANVNDVDPYKHRTFCCGSGGGRFWKEGEGHNAHQSHALRVR